MWEYNVAHAQCMINNVTDTHSEYVKFIAFFFTARMVT